MEATSGVVRNFEWMLQGTTFTSDLIVFSVGRYDFILRALWMRTLGPITIDYSKLTLDFNYQGKHHLLKGISEECKVSSPKVVNKLRGDEVQFFMLQLSANGSIPEAGGQLQTLYMTKDGNIPAPIEQLLMQYQHVFVEPTTLPHQRGAFNHRIPFQPGTKPVNVRPYRYPAMKKDIIEKSVKEILQQGVIQYNNNHFSSPVVLVKKRMDRGDYVWTTENSTNAQSRINFLYLLLMIS